MKEHPLNRSINDLNIVKQYLIKTSMLKILGELKLETNTLNRILNEISTYLECEMLENDQVIFYLGDIATKFYFVVKGTVDIFVPDFKIIQLKPKEYFRGIMLIYNNKDYNLVKQTLMENDLILPISFDDILTINDIMFYEYLRDYLKEFRTLKQILQYFKENKKTKSSYYKVIENKFLSSITDDYFDYSQIIEWDKCILGAFNGQHRIRFSEFSILFQDHIIKNFKFPTYKKLTSIKENQSFGDYAFFNKNRKRY